MFVGQATRQRMQQLPVETTGFVGREAELARLSVLLGHARLVTVTGPGGVGKSRLALRAAAKTAPGFADGVCLVELAHVRDPGLLGSVVARALGLPEHERGARPDAVLSHLADRQLLLILDTCEHLVDACAMLAEAVIARAPRVTLLATSREPLDVSGESACPVPPLPVPDIGLLASSPVEWAEDEPPEAARPVDYRGTAVDLFIQRSSAAVPGFTLVPGDLPHVIRLCQRLDGVPLAIELAAVRLRALPLAELTSRLDQSLALLTSGHRGGRHRSLRDAISWSHELCTPAEQEMWARLSVFAGPFTMRAAEEICGGEGEAGPVMPTLIRLVDKSLLVRIDPVDATAQPTQYLMLGTIREFGAEQLAGTDSETLARRRLAGRYLAMARSFRDDFAGHQQLTRLRELHREHANMRAALEYALGDPTPAGWAADGIELATALCAYWRARGLAAEGSYWLGRAIERAPAGSAARARALLAYGHLLTVLGRPADALAAVSEALSLAAGLGDEALAARAQLVRNGALAAAGQLAAASESGQASWRLLTALDDKPGLSVLDIQLGYLALLDTDSAAALGHVDSGLRRLGGSRERWLRASLYLLASFALYQAGRDIEATWTGTRALEVKHETGDSLGTAFALEVLGWVAARSGSYQRAAWLLGGADSLWERAGGRLAAVPGFGRLHDDAVAGCAAGLGGKLFAELFARGAVHPPEAMVSFGLHDGGDPMADGAHLGLNGQLRLPGQLTAREREIAGLVAAGLSNRQIAERLFISRRTVDAHLEHIFGKLNITSRVMLTIQLREYSAGPASGAGS